MDVSLEEQVWENVQAGDAGGLEDVLVRAMRMGREREVLCVLGQSQRFNMFPLHYAAVNGDAECLAVLCRHGASTSMCTRESYTALHHACVGGFGDCVRVLATNGAELAAVTEDQSFYVAGTAIYLSGGQNALHLAGANGNAEVIAEIRRLATDDDGRRGQWEVLLIMKDNDGNTPFDVAVEGNCVEAAKLLRVEGCDTGELLSEGNVQERRRRTQQKRTKRITAAQRESAEKERTRVRELYLPVHPRLLDQAITTEQLEDLLLHPQAKCIVRSIRARVAAMLDDHDDGEVVSLPTELRSELLAMLKGELEEPCPGVFLWNAMVRRDSAVKLREEFSSYLRSGLPVQRPNVKVPFGMKVNATGLFDALLERLQRDVIQPLAIVLYDEMPKFHCNYTFVKHYEHGKDTEPSTHFDPSELTFSLCLGEEFTGSQIYFHAMEQESCACADRPRVPHPAECAECLCTVTHRCGSVVIHRGRQVHGVYRLKSGTRWQFIVWCRR